MRKMSSTRKAKSRPSAVSISPQQALSLQMLDRLRTYHCTSDREIDLADPLPKTVILPVDKAAYAVSLSYCLAQHFRSVQALLASKTFIVIQARGTDVPAAIAEALFEVAACEGNSVAINPQGYLRSNDRIVIVADVSAAFSDRSVRTIAEAARRGLPVICIASPAEVLPDTLKGADLNLQLPAINNQMLQMVLSACHSEIGADYLSAFKLAGELTVGDLAGHTLTGVTFKPSQPALTSLWTDASIRLLSKRPMVKPPKTASGSAPPSSTASAPACPSMTTRSLAPSSPSCVSKRMKKAWS